MNKEEIINEVIGDIEVFQAINNTQKESTLCKFYAAKKAVRRTYNLTEKEFYTKLKNKLRKIENGTMTLKEYIKEIENK